MIDRDKFDKDFERTEKAITIIQVFVLVFILSVIGCGMFVLYKLYHLLVSLGVF